MDIYKILELLNIKYKVLEHKPTYTLKELKDVKKKLNGTICQTFLVTDKKGRYFLVVFEENKTVNLQTLAQKIRVSNLYYASELDLFGVLRTKPGMVTPFDIANDFDNTVILIIDNKLKDKIVMFQPNGNTKTMALKFSDLTKFIYYEEHKSIYI